MQEEAGQQFFGDINTRLRDIEEKQRLLKERTVLIGKNLISEREQTFTEIQDMKKSTIHLQQEVSRLHAVLQKVLEQLSETARREELAIIQRQIDMLRGVHGNS